MRGPNKIHFGRLTTLPLYVPLEPRYPQFSGFSFQGLGFHAYLVSMSKASGPYRSSVCFFVLPTWFRASGFGFRFYLTGSVYKVV